MRTRAIIFPKKNIKIFFLAQYARRRERYPTLLYLGISHLPRTRKTFPTCEVRSHRSGSSMSVRESTWELFSCSLTFPKLARAPSDAWCRRLEYGIEGYIEGTNIVPGQEQTLRRRSVAEV